MQMLKVVSIAPDKWWQCLLDESTACLPDLAHVQRQTFISPATDPHVIDGNATLGIELAAAHALRNATEIHVLVPYGGGGLLTGLARGMRVFFQSKPDGFLNFLRARWTLARPCTHHCRPASQPRLSISRRSSTALAHRRCCPKLLPP